MQQIVSTVRLRPTRGRGFTLTELMVAIGIIVLLIGIAFPAIAHVQALAQRSTCLSNLRQIGMAAQSYRVEYNQLLPQVPPLPVDPSQSSVMDSFERYGPPDIWRCPADDELFEETGSSYEYLIRYFLLFLADDDDRAAQRRIIREIERANQIPLMIDAEAWHRGGPEDVGRNAVYLDGRVDWLRSEPPPTPGD